MSTSSLVVFLSCILLITLRLNTAQNCNFGTGNFTTNSTYGKNRDLALSSLASNVTANGGYYAATLGQGSDTAYAVGFCRGDISKDKCFNCVDSKSQEIIKNCPNQKEAINWGSPPLCTVRCSYKSLLGVMDTSPAMFVSNTNNITNNVDEFDQALNSLVDSLVLRAAAMGGSSSSTSSSSRHKFVTGKENFTKYENIYALMQCTPDLSSGDCNICLNGAVDDYRSCCNRKQAVNVLRPSCDFHYDLSLFYESTADASPPPPPPAVTFAPPPPSTPWLSTDTTRKQGYGDTTRTIVVIVISTITFVMVPIVSVCILLRKTKQRKHVQKDGLCEAVDEITAVESLQCDFDTISDATDNFSNANKLGQGGFGIVYRGRLPNGQEIAVKRLSRNSRQGELEFKNEVMLVAKLQHRNLARLLGFCFEGTERLLIYEYVTNLSLDHFIFDPINRAQLDWDRRYKIIGGVSRGLLYLHEDSRFRIIHRDLKASNVLLDAEMNAKISDFGLAKLFVFDETQGNTSRIVGTYGYMAPEYAMHGQFSVKSDVFSFGVLVLEIVSGRKNNCFHNGENGEDLLSYAWKSWREETGSNLIDPTLKVGSGSLREMMRCIHIGLLCVQENVAIRPTMSSVVLMLSSFSLTLPLPSEPAFFLHSSINLEIPLLQEDNFGISKSRKSTQSHVSVNEASITELYPR